MASSTHPAKKKKHLLPTFQGRVTSREVGGGMWEMGDDRRIAI